jgi:hypothetical protein
MKFIRDHINKVIESSSLESIIQLKIGTGWRSLINKIYLSISDYQIETIIGSGDVLFFYSEDLRRREDFRYLMNELASNVDNSKLVIYKRKINFKINLNIKRKVIFFADTIDLSNLKAIIIFCPHVMLGQAVLLKAKKMNLKTICLQHGYYSYSTLEDKIFREANNCDVAIAYDDSFFNFFENCKKVLIAGPYASGKKVSMNVVCPVLVFLPYLNTNNSRQVGAEIEAILEMHDVITMKLHPRQSENEIKKYLTLDKTRTKVKKTSTDSIGKYNYFIETTAWMKMNLKNVDAKFFIVANRQFKLINKETGSNIGKISKIVNEEISS